ncbi:Hypothetical protein I595_3121 [Croceitalea dokdonensis DOKDO 023]|uniref:Lipocalin-like domain-containing protein n=1 Tax=Croceitalea dokdonensis DOKDO 023 TaxID=1300341 RepID=A0A0P7ANI8_9FLAO|nr:hypothetical protein [Croceitalea dokdonensis]KPM30627.1 Hypothetical protein I595_3121 [Croceitalea dokdonensis DOKDO 023]
MKKLLSLMAVMVLIAVSNCTQIPENNDPILGIWSKLPTSIIEKQENIEREEWIFNDVYLGRYRRYSQQQVSLETDFKWSKEDGLYTLDYTAPEMPVHLVKLNRDGTPEKLEEVTGAIFAIRE